MTRAAEHVYTDQRDIARLEGWMKQLDDEAMVEIRLQDGRCVRGVVIARPTVQMFFDAQGREGMNGVVRIDDVADPELSHFLWLDQITAVERIGTD